jgi:hypothetical protein
VYTIAFTNLRLLYLDFPTDVFLLANS